MIKGDLTQSSIMKINKKMGLHHFHLQFEIISEIRPIKNEITKTG